MSDSSSYKILIVDDHGLSRKLLVKQLEILGFNEIDVSTDGQQAFEMLGDAHYDIIMLDWAMPVMDGMKFLTSVRNREEMKHTAVLMISSEAQPDHILKALDAGAVSYLTKPVTMEALTEALKKITDWIERRKAAG